jgi:23S rRNA pseudouridine2605 synthase
MTQPSERLAKRIARAGVCSRRDAEKLIEQGVVYVNGLQIVTPAFNVTVKDQIMVNGQELADIPQPRLWGYYKPEGVLTTHKDPQGRPTLFSELPKSLSRVISIGRLDLNSEGLILLTNDSRLARYAELPTTGWARCYKVRVFGDVNEQQLADLVHGITIDGMTYGRIEADLVRQSGRNAWITVTIYEGKNREIRKVMNYLGLKVNRLMRLAYGPFQMKTRQPRDLWEIPYAEFSRHFPVLKEESRLKRTFQKGKPRPTTEKRAKLNAHYRRKI